MRVPEIRRIQRIGHPEPIHIAPHAAQTIHCSDKNHHGIFRHQTLHLGIEGFTFLYVRSHRCLINQTNHLGIVIIVIIIYIVVNSQTSQKRIRVMLSMVLSEIFTEKMLDFLSLVLKGFSWERIAAWWRSWTSNPVWGTNTVLGGFDSHAFPPR